MCAGSVGVVLDPQHSQCHDFDTLHVLCWFYMELFWGPQRSQRHDFDTFLCCAGSTVCCFGVNSLLSVMILIFPVLCWFYSVVLGSTAFSES